MTNERRGDTPERELDDAALLRANLIGYRRLKKQRAQLGAREILIMILLALLGLAIYGILASNGVLRLVSIIGTVFAALPLVILLGPASRYGPEAEKASMLLELNEALLNAMRRADAERAQQVEAQYRDMERELRYGQGPRT